jgi:uncharacterized membrane protein
MISPAIVGVHIAVASAAHVTRFGALAFPNGTKTHKRLGVGYLVCWGVLAVTAFFFGAQHAGVGAFEVCTTLGATSVIVAYGQVLLRKRSGKRWMRRHYIWMLLSLAALLGPTTNQILWHLGLNYPKLVFFLIIGAPWTVVPFYVRRLDARYGKYR